MNRFLSFIFVFSSLSLFSQEGNPLETVLQQGHSKYVTSADIDPSGKFAVTGGFDNSIILWNIQTGKIVRTYNKHTEAVWSVAFSKDGKQILSTSADQSIILYDVVSGKQVHSWKMPKDDIREAHFSMDGKFVVMVNNREKFFVADRESGKRIGEYSKNYSSFYQKRLIDPTGQKVLNTSSYKGVDVFKLGTEDTLLHIPFEKAFGMAFSPDGSKISISSSKQFAKIFDAETGKEIAHLEDPDNDAQCDGCHWKQVWSNSGKYLLTMSNKIDPILWDASSGKKIRIFNEIRKRPTVLRFSSDDSHIVMNIGKVLYAYNTKTGKKTLELQRENLNYYDINFDPTGNNVIVPGVNNTAEVWNVASGKKVIVLKGYLNHERTDGLKYSYSNWTDAGILKYVSARRQFALSPDNKYVVFGAIDSVAMMMEIATGKTVRTFEGHSQVVIAMAFSPDGKTLATAGGDRHVKLFDVASGKEIDDLGYHRDLIFDLGWNSTSTQLVSASWDGSMALWDMEEETYEFKDLGKNSAYCIDFTPDGLYMVTGDLGGGLTYHESDALEPFRTLVGNKEVLGDFDFTQDGSKIATASWDGFVKVWDHSTGMQIARSKEHKGAINAVSWHPGRDFLAFAGADNIIEIWDPFRDTIIVTFHGHNNAVSCLEFTTDGTKLVSQSVDGVIKVWSIGKGEEEYSRIQISRNEWLTTTKSGYFDGSSKALGLVNYVSGMEVVPVGSLFDKYFSPGLIKRINEGETFDDRSENIGKLMEEKPLIAFHLSESSKRSLPVEVDSVYRWKKQMLPLGIRINSQDQQLEEIRIYNNGKLVIAESLEENLVFRGGEKDVRHYEVPLTDGENNITGLVINQDRTESSPTNILVEYDGEASKTDLYILSIGINDYKNPKYNLDYAVNDSKSFTKAVSKGGDTLFNQVFEYPISNDGATKLNIEATIAEIKEKIGPEDVFLFYYAGHGVMGYAKDPADADFYVVTYDVTNLYGEAEMLEEKAISASELMQYSMQISAEKQLFVLDACHSGGALNSLATRGDGREKALAQLARSTGTFFLTASQDAQYANEVGDLKHGLFTYALLEIIGGQGDNGDQKVTINEIKSYVEDRVPELSEAHRGSPQYPTSYSFGQDFPIVILK